LNISSPLLFHGKVHVYKSAEHIPRRPDFGRSPAERPRIGRHRRGCVAAFDGRLPGHTTGLGAMAASWHPWHADQDGHDRPGQLDLVVAIDLRGLALIFPGSAPEAKDAVSQQPGDDGEDNGKMPRTNQARSRMANAGVEVGAKIVGVCTDEPSPRANAVAAE
jgi:hypothetical protein